MEAKGEVTSSESSEQPLLISSICVDRTEKMQRRLRITDDYSRKLSIRRKVKEENIYWRTSLEEWEAVARRRFERRSAFLTLLTVDPDGTTRVVSLPVQYRVNAKSSEFGAQVNLESLRLFYTKPPNPLTFIRPSVPLGSRIIGVYCRKSFTNEISTDSSKKQQCQNREVANEATKWNELSCETGSSSKSFSDSISGSKMIDNVKRRTTKKRRKKGKKGKKKLSVARKPTEPYSLSVEHANGSSAPETCGNNGGRGHCVEEDTPSPGNFGNHGVFQDSEFLINDGIMSISHAEVNHWNSVHARCTFDMDDSSSLDSLSTGSNCGDNSDGQGENSAEKYEQSSCSSGRAYISCQSFSDDDSDTDDNWDRLSPPMYLPHLLSKAGVQAQEETLLSKSSSRHSSSGSLNHNSAHVYSDEEADKSLTAIDTANILTQNISSVEVAACAHSDEEADQSGTPADAAKGIAQNISSVEGIAQNISFIELAESVHSDDEADKSGTPTGTDKGITQNITSIEVSVSVHLDEEADKKWIPADAASGITENISSGEVTDPLHSDEEADKSCTPTGTAQNITQNSSSVEVAVCVQSDEEGDKSWYPTDAAKGSAQNISLREVVVCGHWDEETDKSRTPTDAAEGITQNISSTEVEVCAGQDCGDLNAVEAESHRILKAVKNAYRAQLASEEFQTATGGPVAEFEKILHYSSPVVEYPNIIRCQTCSRNQTPGLVVCEHVTTHIGLGCLWKWYQINGSYGIEIRSEEFRKSKGMIAFCAYYVPYLSGVQVFQSCRSNLACSTPAAVNDSILSSDLELLFEFFESEKPQHRAPLYVRIEELIRGDEPVSNIYGDPTILETINLNEIHPASWFAVAWYPIYRIPEGNLRAAFLTYHSLGHLAIQSVDFENPGADARIVSPVVGLQSYNEQDESWFEVKHSGLMQTTATPVVGVNSSCEVFKVRLKTLEETASLMARAVVKKGNLASVNRHPDYEFFLARRR